MRTLPDSWTLSTIGEIGKIASGGTPSSKQPSYFEGDIPWLTPKDLSGYSEKFISRGARNISQEALENSSAKLLPKGTVLFSSRAPVGYCAIANNEISTNQGFKNLIPSDAVCSDYVYHYLKGNKSLAEEYASGTTFLELSAKAFSRIPIPVPPLPEQRRIVARIEELFSRLDAGVAELHAAKAQLKRYRQSVLNAAVTGELTKEWRERNPKVEPASELLERILQQRREQWPGKGKYKEPLPIKPVPSSTTPSSWTQVNLDSITTILGDGLHGTPKYDSDGEFYFINGNNLSYGKILLKDNTKRVSESEFLKYKKPLNQHTILVSINGTLGNTAFYSNEKVILGKSACYFNLAPVLNKYFVEAVLRTNRFISYLHNTATGSTIKNVPLKAMRAFNFTIPPLAEQEQIVAEVEARTTVIGHLETELDQQISRSHKLRQSILSKAFEGELS
jgi:type I restriction enzyme S subunit